METKEKGKDWALRMKQLPKAEYALMKELIEKYKLKDAQEVFVVSLRVLYEVLHYRLNEDKAGQKWVVNTIAAWKGNSSELREYEVPPLE